MVHVIRVTCGVILNLLSEEDSWHCLLCKVKFHQYNFPFTLCDDTEIQNLNNSNSMSVDRGIQIC